MSYRCPACTGEFEELTDGECPWCGQAADGTFEREQPDLLDNAPDLDDMQADSMSPFERMFGGSS